jgi:FG-GAP repeat protein/astacin (peptidase family M12A)
MKDSHIRKTLVILIVLVALCALLMTKRLRPVQAEDDRWPNNVVTFYIDQNVSPDHEQGIRAAIDTWQKRTALRFEEITNEADLASPTRPSYLHYIDRGSKYHSYSYKNIKDDGDLDAFPNLRSGDWVIKFVACTVSDPCNPPNEPWLNNSHIPLHETGHVLGLPHEANRSDRGSVVRYYPCCVDDSPESFDKELQHVEALKRYDIDSVMQYGSTTHCKKSGGTCVCLPLLEKTDDAYTPNGTSATDLQMKNEDGECTETDVTGREINPPGGLSQEDVNTIYQMYPPSLGNNETADHFGEAMAQGDFDGDGYSDLAVGAPDEAPGDDPASGAVFLFKGTYTGLVSWRTITQTGLGNNDSGDRFGETLAAGDLNHDGKDELIVGAPGEKIPQQGPNPKAGAVFVFLGSQTGPTTTNGYLLHENNIGFTDKTEDGDLFGASLAVGNFNGDTRHDLAIGAPGKKPGGRVFVLAWDKDRPSGDKFVKFDRVGMQRGAGDDFGTAIHAVDVNNDNFDDLVVGAPGLNNDTGAIFVFPGASTKLHEPATIKQPEGAPRKDGDQFGAALASGHFSTGSRPQIVVGVPGKMGTGWIFVLRLVYQGRSFDRIDKWDAYDQDTLALSEPNDHFGEVFAVADFDRDGKDDLAVGIPRKDGYYPDATRVLNAGGVALFRGNTVDEFLVPWKFYWQPESYLPNRALDHFGSALAAANFNRTPAIPDLAIGVPGKGTDSTLESGAVYVARGQRDAGDAPHLSNAKNPSIAAEPPANASFYTFFDQELARRR